MNYTDIPQNRLYGELAHLWPLVSQPEDYADEARLWSKAILDRLGYKLHLLLELGCGGGNLLSHIKNDFKATATDLSPQMLQLSQRLNPTVHHARGDMRDLRLGTVFDAVIIHDAINYMLNKDDLTKAFRTAWEHLRPGGIFVTSPDRMRETFVSGTVRSSTFADGLRELTHVEYEFDPDPTDTSYESLMTYILHESGKTTVEYDRHTCGLFSHQQWQDWIAEAGFEVALEEYPVHEDQRQSWLYVGVKR